MYMVFSLSIHQWMCGCLLSLDCCLTPPLFLLADGVAYHPSTLGLCCVCAFTLFISVGPGVGVVLL